MLLRAGAVSLALLLASRLLGVVRESAQAAAFGTSGLGDVAVLMLTLPDWLSGVLVAGALTYVLLPWWAQQPAAHHAAIQRRVAVRLMAGGILLGGILWLGQDSAVAWLAPGIPEDLRGVAGSALAASAVALPLALLAALWATRLQHERDFTGMYAANLVVNGVLIGALAGMVTHADPPSAMARLGFWLVAAMLLRLVWLGWRQRSQEPVNAALPSSAAALPDAPVWLWAALSAGLPLTLPFIARTMASHAGEGELATFNYAWKLVELPLVLAIQLVATLSFPAIARAFADAADPAPVVRQAFALAWALACAAAAALLLGGPAFSQLLFGWGRMTDGSVARLAGWAAVGAWGLLPQALIAVSLTVLASVHRLRPMVAAYAAGMALLLLAGQWANGDGGRLMAVLNGVLALVALTGVASLGRPAAAWVPWRAMLAPVAVLAAIAALRASWPGLGGMGLAAGLGAGGVAAAVVLAVAAMASADMRLALRR